MNNEINFPARTVDAGGNGAGFKRGGATRRVLISPWQKERRARLSHIMRAIDKALAKGRTLHQALACPTRNARNQAVWRCEPNRKLRLGKGSLLRIYYHWRKHGRTATALELRYNTPRVFSPAIALQFLKLCVAPGVIHKKQAARRMRGYTGGYDSLSRSLSPEINRALVRLHRARRFTAAREKRFFQMLARA